MRRHGNGAPRILILGAGPTGLGAAQRLSELGHGDYLVLERNRYAGGLSASFVDPQGFTWDLGGHIQFSHYDHFDQVLGQAYGDGWIDHVRQSHVWLRERFVPYPFQYNLRHLPKSDLWRCVRGMIEADRNRDGTPGNFRDWILSSFGEGIAGLFLFPYNFKVWAHPLEMLSYGWVGERVAVLNLERALENIILERDDAAWGPNQTFRFPRRGGTGAIWRAVAGQIPGERLLYGAEVAGVDPGRRVVRLRDGREFRYDALISTLPLDALAEMSGRRDWMRPARRLSYSSTHVAGIGLEGRTPERLRGRNWMYFPEDNCPFYRVTVFSNYSPENVPDPGRHWSLMAEISESRHKAVDRDRVVEDTVRGLEATGLLPGGARVVSAWTCFLPRGYPVPTCDRDELLGELLPRLEEEGILSRGRFGAWKYEVANQDHCFMQGVEAADRLLLGTPETTVHDPQRVNSGGSRNERLRGASGQPAR